MLILSNDDIEQLLSMKDCLEVPEETYRHFGNGRAVGGPRCDILPLLSLEIWIPRC